MPSMQGQVELVKLRLVSQVRQLEFVLPEQVAQE
jgi:hypothetical protein